MKRLLTILVIFIGCSEENIAPIITDSASGIWLANLSNGQTAQYLSYTSHCGKGFKFTGDTLTIAVLEENDTLYIQESFTDGSPNSGFSMKYYVIKTDAYLLIPERRISQLFGFYGNDTLFLDKKPTAELVQNGCRFNLNGENFTGEQIGSIDRFRFGQIDISNKKGVSCIPTIFQLDGYLIYDEYLTVSHRIVLELEQVSGFVAISENKL